jgi:hypothetical protein
MATSGEIDGLLTVRTIIRSALELIGADDNHEDAETYSKAMRHLNWMLKGMQLDGVNMWRIEDIEITWPANQPYQDFGTDIVTPTNIIDVQDARVSINPTFQRSLGRFEYGDYVVLPNKEAAGAPTTYSFWKRTGGARLFMWMVPNVDTTIYLTIARVIEDVTGLGQNIDIPQEFTEVVYYSLAAKLCDIMGITQGAPSLAAEIKRQAAQMYALAKAYDRPASVYMKPWQTGY